MFKFFSMLSAFLISSASLTYASDRLEDVKASYERSMKRALEAEKTETKPCTNTEKLKQGTWDEKIATIVDSLTENLGIEANSIFTQEQLLQKSEAFNTKLYHALTASICHMSDYLKSAQNDPSLEWTQQHSYCFGKPGIRYPIEGVTHQFAKNKEGTLTVALCQNAQMYEIQRQRICLELTSLWDLLVFWKKSIFPNDNIQSYSFYGAHALKNQIYNQLNRRKDLLKTIQIDIENTNLDHYPLVIIDMLEDILNALPIEIEHRIMVTTKMNSQDIELKIKRNKKMIAEKRVIYDTAYEEAISKYINVDKHIACLIHDPFAATNSKYFPVNFKMAYTEFQKHRFPSVKGNIKFSHAPLNFTKLMGEITNTSLFPENSFKDENEPSLIETDQSTTPVTIHIEKDKYATNEEEPEMVVYDQAYWEAEHQMHLERKKAALINANNLQNLSNPQTLAIQVDTYEENLHNFLRDRIYTYTKITSRKLKKELKALKFNVVPNNTGNGSVHYIMPTKDNPLFGTNLNYAGAYFNVHLPSNDGDIIPSAYFNFIQSGFANVFGLKLYN